MGCRVKGVRFRVERSEWEVFFGLPGLPPFVSFFAGACLVVAVQCVGFKVQGLGCMVYDLGVCLRACGSCSRVQGVGVEYRVWVALGFGLGFGDSGVWGLEFEVFGNYHFLLLPIQLLAVLANLLPNLR